MHINWNEAENTMGANVLSFYTPMTPALGQNVKTIVFLKKVILNIK